MKRYFIYIGLIFFVFIPASIWLAAFLSPVYAGKDTPSSGFVTNNPNQVISFKWLGVPFVKAKSAKIFLDGKQVKGLKITKRGFTYKPGKLNDGKHVVYVIASYDFPYPRTVERLWYFTIDTEAPFIAVDFNDSNTENGYVVSTSDVLKIKGKTEKGAVLEQVLNGTTWTSGKSLEVGPDGDFTGEMSLKETSASLSFYAKDIAGNKSRADYKVIYDVESPRVEEHVPGSDQSLYGYPVDLKVKASDKESWIKSVETKIGDNNTVVMNLNVGYYTASAELPDGDHKAVFTVTDAAGRTTVKEINFKVDTTKIVVSRAKRELYLYKQGKLAKTYRVAVGKPVRPTPAGNFRIIRKRVNPTWVNPGSSWAKSMPNRIPPGPDNPLGTRAMDISVDAIRIHGTPNAASIGQAASNGCVRMYKWQAEELFGMVKVGTPVIIY